MLLTKLVLETERVVLPPTLNRLSRLQEIAVQGPGEEWGLQPETVGPLTLLSQLPALSKLAVRTLRFRDLGWVQALTQLTALSLHGCRLLVPDEEDDDAAEWEQVRFPALPLSEFEAALCPLTQASHVWKGDGR
ncbi:hypothetical protein ABPG75_000875 [Micractinium tetrahymenae]